MTLRRIFVTEARIEGNKARDARNLRALSEMGWMTLTLWECELGDLEVLKERIKAFLA